MLWREGPAQARIEVRIEAPEGDLEASGQDINQQNFNRYLRTLRALQSQQVRLIKFGINRYYPQEIVDARKPLYKEKKELKIQNPRANIAIQYPAKLVMDGRVIRDMFPEWYSTIRLNRLVDNYPPKEKAKLIETDSSVVFRPTESSPFEDTDTDQDDEDLVCSMESQSILQNDAGMVGAIPKSRQVQDTSSSK